jgi:MFS family permease
MQEETELEEVTSVSEPASNNPLKKYKSKISWKQTFASLQYRNYRLWFWGQMVSMFGTWMQITAQGFLIYQLTHSPAYLGYVGFASGIPTWLFMMYGGVVADRMPRRNILVVTQASMMVLAFILAFLTFTGAVQAWHIIMLAFMLGVANAFDAPSRQAFVLELVKREDLTNAIALNSTLFNSATAVGPAVAGITYAIFGPAWCFMINALSFLGVIAALLRMKLNVQARKSKNGKSTLDELKEGIKYTVHHREIRTIIMLVAVISVFGISYVTLIPAWAVKILGGDATTNGYLQSARGFGALMSALVIASLGRFQFKGKLLILGSFMFPSLLILFSFMRWLPLSLLVLVGVGSSLILVFNLANALVQTLVIDHLRGRVMGVYTASFFGLMPIGALIMGTLAENFGSMAAVVTGACIAIATAAVISFFVPSVKRLP